MKFADRREQRVGREPYGSLDIVEAEQWAC